MKFTAFEIALLAVCGIGLISYLWSQRWKPYDPSWLVALAEEQLPDSVELHEALRKCTRIRGNYFVNSRSPNKPGSEWQFDRSITLEHPDFDDVIIDVLKDGRVGSIEYLGLMLGQGTPGDK
jgi:hypothetical protein